MPPRTFLLVFCAVLTGPAVACGWWGDGEHRSASPAQLVDAQGRPLERVDAMQDPELMLLYGDRFRSGNGAPRDLNLAHHWYRLAAEHGHPGGQYNLALMLEQGIGVVADPAAAARWYRAAAGQGDVHAQHHLGRMYLDGRGVARDPVAGLAWLRRAAEQGHAEVFTLLAEGYATGVAGTVDEDAAYQWYWSAVREGDPLASRRLAELEGRLSAPRRTAAVTRAEALGQTWEGTSR